MPSGDTEAVETTSTTLAFPFERIIPRRTHLNIRYTSTTTIKQLLRSYNPPNPQTPKPHLVATFPAQKADDIGRRDYRRENIGPENNPKTLSPYHAITYLPEPTPERNPPPSILNTLTPPTKQQHQNNHCTSPGLGFTFNASNPSEIRGSFTDTRPLSSPYSRSSVIEQPRLYSIVCFFWLDCTLYSP